MAYKYKKKQRTLQCVECKNSFVTSRPNAKVCSRECRQFRYNKKHGRISNTNIPTGTVGAISEMVVAMDLMEKGYSVFRALSAHCFCDLIAIKDEKSIKVEVRTGYISASGNLAFPKSPKDKNRQDVFGIYVRSQKEIRYFLPSGAEITM